VGLIVQPITLNINLFMHVSVHGCMNIIAILLQSNAILYAISNVYDPLGFAVLSPRFLIEFKQSE